MMNTPEDYVQTISALHREYKKYADEVLSLQEELRRVNRERAAYAEQLRIYAPTFELAKVRKAQKFDDQPSIGQNTSESAAVNMTSYASLSSAKVDNMSPSELEQYFLELRVAVERASKNIENSNVRRIQEGQYVSSKVDSILKSLDTGL